MTKIEKEAFILTWKKRNEPKRKYTVADMVKDMRKNVKNIKQ